MAVSNYVGAPWPTVATWSPVGTTTEADSTDVASTIGNASVYKVVNTAGIANTNLCRPNQFSFPSAGTYYLSALVYVPTGSTGDVDIVASSWTGITQDATNSKTTGQKDQWVLIKRVITLDGTDLLGRPTINSTGTTTNTDIVYIDWAGATVEDPSTTIRYPTPAQISAGTSVWAGTPNASTATYTEPAAASSVPQHTRISSYTNRRRRV